MSVCEMCGKEEKLITAEVESVEMQLCPNCSKYGKIKKKVTFSQGFRSQKSSNQGPELRIVANYSSLLRKARESKGMTQQDFAKMLNEKESVIVKWEQGSLKPRIGMAKRIGRIIKINLLEKDIPGEVDLEKTKATGEFTLGDFVKVRKRN
jgi:putative transcription factor